MKITGDASLNQDAKRSMDPGSAACGRSPINLSVDEESGFGPSSTESHGLFHSPNNESSPNRPVDLDDEIEVDIKDENVSAHEPVGEGSSFIDVEGDDDPSNTPEDNDKEVTAGDDLGKATVSNSHDFVLDSGRVLGEGLQETSVNETDEIDWDCLITGTYSLPTTGKPAEIPAYEVESSSVLAESEVATTNKEQKQKKQVDRPAPIPTRRSCFNCSGNHFLNKCPHPKNFAEINYNRQNYFSSKGSSGGGSTGKRQRYHEVPDQEAMYLSGETLGRTYSNFRPGVVSKELREALGLGPMERPQYINKMRKVGYPPGYARLAHELLEPGLIELENTKEVVPKSKLTELSALLDRIPQYPGYHQSLITSYHEEGSRNVNKELMKTWAETYPTDPITDVDSAWDCLVGFRGTLREYLNELDKQVNPSQGQSPGTWTPSSSSSQAHTSTRDFRESTFGSQPTNRGSSVAGSGLRKSGGQKRPWYDDLSDPEVTATPQQSLGSFAPRAPAASSSTGNYRTTMLKEEEERRESDRLAALQVAKTQSTAGSSSRPSKRSSSPSLLDNRKHPRKYRRVSLAEQSEEGSWKRTKSPSLLEDYPFSSTQVSLQSETIPEITLEDDDDDIVIIDVLPSRSQQTKNHDNKEAIDSNGLEPEPKKVKLSVPPEAGDETTRTVEDSSPKPKRRAPPAPIISGVTMGWMKDEDSENRQNIISGSNEPKVENSDKIAPKAAAVEDEDNSEVPSPVSDSAHKKDVTSPFVRPPALQALMEKISSAVGSPSSDESEGISGSVPEATDAAGKLPDVSKGNEEVQGAANSKELPSLEKFSKGMTELPREEQHRTNKLARILHLVHGTKQPHTTVESSANCSFQDHKERPLPSQHQLDEIMYPIEEVEPPPEELVELISDEEEVVPPPQELVELISDEEEVEIIERDIQNEVENEVIDLDSD